MQKKTNWEDVGFVASSEYRKNVLRSLITPNVPLKLSKDLKYNKSHVSRALKELSDKKMIECKNPDARKGRIYVILEYGKAILKEIDKL